MAFKNCQKLSVHPVNTPASNIIYLKKNSLAPLLCRAYTDKSKATVCGLLFIYYPSISLRNKLKRSSVHILINLRSLLVPIVSFNTHSGSRKERFL
jgi:hypothetical protein